MECYKNKKKEKQDKTINKLILLIDDLNKQQNMILDYIQKLEEVIKIQKNKKL